MIRDSECETLRSHGLEERSDALLLVSGRHHPVPPMPGLPG